MKGLMKSALIILMAILWLNIGHAQTEKTKYTAREVYEFFEQYSPQYAVDYARKAVKHYSKITQKAISVSKKEEEEIFGKALLEFHEPPSEWPVSRFPLMFFAIPQRCDQARVTAHYVPTFFSPMSKIGFLKKYRDVKGKKVIGILCKKIRNSKNGVWTMQYQWWPQTDKPMYMGVFLLKIPNTPYEIQMFYPTKKYTEEQLNDKYKK